MIIFLIKSFEERIFRSSPIFFDISSKSFSTLFLSSPVNLCSLSSNIAFACSLDKYVKPSIFFANLSSLFLCKRAAKFFDCHLVFTISAFASLASFEALMIAIILSIFSIATAKPIKTCSFSLALYKSKEVLLIITSIL